MLAGDPGLHHPGIEDGRGTKFVEVAVDDDEVGVVAGDQLALVLFGEFGVGGALRVGVESLAARELVLRRE